MQSPSSSCGSTRRRYVSAQINAKKDGECAGNRSVTRVVGLFVGGILQRKRQESVLWAFEQSISISDLYYKHICYNWKSAIGHSHAQSSYLSQISQIIFVEKKLPCGEISAFYTKFEHFMDFYWSLGRCSKSIWRKSVWRKNDKYEVWSCTNLRKATGARMQRRACWLVGWLVGE